MTDGAERDVLAQTEAVVYHFFTKFADVILDARLGQQSGLEESDLELAEELLFSVEGGSELKRSSWFGVDAPKCPHFVDELKLWRGLREPPIPSLVLGILLDPTGLPKNSDEVLIINRGNGGKSIVLESAAEQGPTASAGPARTPILIERWTVELRGEKDNSTDLVHLFQMLKSILGQVQSAASKAPANALRRRLTKDRGTLMIGVQISAEDPSEPSAIPRVVELGVEEYLQSQTKNEVLSARDNGKGNDASVAQRLGEIGTPFGTLQVSVEYLKDVDFTTDTLSRLKTERQKALEEMIILDQDYFRFKPTVPSQVKDPANVGANVSRNTGQEPQRGSSFGWPSVPGSSGSSSPRPVAGLSSFRTPIPIPSAKSSSVAAALSSSPEPAFLAASRRVSNQSGTSLGPSGAGFAGSPASISGDRRLRRVSTYDKGSPPSPSSIGSGSLLSRQASFRSASNPTGGGSPFRGGGSFSPSSPSPLAQQFNASRDNLDSSQRPVSYSQSGRGSASMRSSQASLESGLPSLRSIFTNYDVGSVRNRATANLSSGTSRPVAISAPQTIPRRTPSSHPGSAGVHASWSLRESSNFTRTSASSTGDDDLQTLVRLIDDNRIESSELDQNTKSLSTPASLDPARASASLHAHGLSKNEIDTMLSKMFMNLGPTPTSGESAGPDSVGQAAAGSPSTQRSPLSQPPFTSNLVSRYERAGTPEPIPASPDPQSDRESGDSEHGKSSITMQYEEATGALELTTEDIDSPEARRLREEQRRVDAEMSSRFTRDLGATRGNRMRHRGQF